MMKLRAAAITLTLALAITACGDRSVTSPSTPAAAAPAAAHLDLASDGSTINGLIDQLFASPVIRAYVHAVWNSIVAQVSTCPPSTTALAIQSSFNNLTSFIQSNAHGNSAKQALAATLVADMANYVNEAIAACPST